ncbi:hypothetical protein PENNAL_c0120G00431, partial [Penicillium nalgiovense]
MALQFIDQSPSGITRTDRSIIRSHVMRGKNTGKQCRFIKKQKDATDLNDHIHTLGFGYVIP